MCCKFDAAHDIDRQIRDREARWPKPLNHELSRFTPAEIDCAPGRIRKSWEGDGKRGVFRGAVVGGSPCERGGRLDFNDGAALTDVALHCNDLGCKRVSAAEAVHEQSERVR